MWTHVSLGIGRTPRKIGPREQLRAQPCKYSRYVGVEQLAAQEVVTLWLRHAGSNPVTFTTGVVRSIMQLVAKQN